MTYSSGRGDNNDCGRGNCVEEGTTVAEVAAIEAITTEARLCRSVTIVAVGGEEEIRDAATVVEQGRRQRRQ
ncbi:hypothetical protein B296_00015132 [Ensete ventricosum]|uniref:Uncharacterized protein n=1 Tax=Ensete ventricosum TaxID=4639 RepID=A0A427B498_ENSVE|nr:hypothetical protein B296_00015132 [Ensete ventricosum]